MQVCVSPEEKHLLPHSTARTAITVSFTLALLEAHVLVWHLDYKRDMAVKGNAEVNGKVYRSEKVKEIWADI